MSCDTRISPKPSQREKPGLDSITVDRRSDYSSTYEWVIPNLSKVKARELFTPDFELGEFHFRLLVYPKGAPGYGLKPGYFVSLGVEIDIKSRVANVGCFAGFKLTLVNHLDDSKSLHEEWYDRFCGKEVSFRWEKFAVSSEIIEPRSGFMINDSLLLRADVRIVDESITFPGNSVAEESNYSNVGKFSWKISNFSLFKEVIKTQRITSPTFRIGLYEYRLCIHESLDEGIGYLSLYLETDVIIDVIYRSFWGMFGISVLNQNPELHHMHKKSHGRFGVSGGDDLYRGWRFYTKMSDFLGSEKGFLLNDRVIFCVTYNVFEESYLTYSPALNLTSVEKIFSSFCEGDEETGMFFWRIKNFPCLKDTMKKKKMTGIRVESRNVRMAKQDFCLVVYPRGQSHIPSYLSLFLEVLSSQHSCDWSILLGYRLGIVKCGDVKNSIIKQSLRRCYKDTRDLGWWDFVALATLFDQNSGFMLEGLGAAVFYAEVRILKETFTEDDLAESCDGKRKSFTWRVESFLSCTEIVTTQKIVSRFFKVAGSELRIGVFVSVDTVYVYLDCDPSRSSDPNGNFWVSFRIAIVNQKDPNKTLWKKSSLYTKTCNNYHFPMGKLSDILEPNAGYIVGGMIIFVCEILDYNPWFEFSEPEVSVCDDGEVASISDIGEPVNSTDTEQSVQRNVNDCDGKPLNSKDTELSARREVDVEECNFSSLSDFGEPVSSKETELIVKNKVDFFNLKDMISSALCLLMNEYNSPQLLGTLKEKLQLDIYTLAEILLRLRFHLDDLDKIKPLPHSYTSGIGELKDASSESFPSSEKLIMAIKGLQQKIDDGLIDIMLECCQSIEKKPSLDSCDASSMASVVTHDAVSQLELHGDIGRVDYISSHILWGLGFDKDLQCLDLNTFTTIQTILGPLISQLGTVAYCPLVIRSAADSQSMTEPLEELLGVIVNFLKPLRAPKSAICLGSLQGHQLAGEISCIVDKAPKGMQPYLIAFLLKLVNPLENPLAACKLLDQLQKMDAESVLQPPWTSKLIDYALQHCAAVRRSHSIRNKLWEHVFFQILKHLAVSNDETLDLIICLLFRTASLCQHIPQAVRAVCAKLEELSPAIPARVLNLISETIKSWYEVAEAMLREIYSFFESDDLTINVNSDNGLGTVMLPLIDEQYFVDHQFSNIYMLVDLLYVPSLFGRAAKAFEKGIVHGFIVHHLVARVLERHFIKNLKVDAQYSGKYPHENVTEVEEEICYLEDADFTILTDLAETLSTSDNPGVGEFVRMLYSTLFKLFSEENHRKKLLKGLFDHAIISTENSQRYMDVLFFLVHGEYDAAKQVLNMMREATMLAKDDQAVLCHQLSAIREENNHKTEEWQAEISSLNKEKAILLERLSASEATITQCKSEIRCQWEQLVEEKKNLSELTEVENQLQLLCSEQHDKIEMLLKEKNGYQDRLCKTELQLEELQRQKCNSEKLIVEKDCLAGMLRNAQAERIRLENILKQYAGEAILQESWCKSLLDEILRLQQEVEKSEKERQKKDEEASLYKAYVEEMEGRLTAYQQHIRSLEVSLQEDVSTRNWNFPFRP